jgi:disulfide bond formation protein DsbB
MNRISAPAASALLALAAAAGLGAALALERWGGLVPCALCLLERWPYRVLIGLGVVGAILPERLARAALWLALLAGLASIGLAVVHVGVERKAWPSPLPECAAPRLTGGSIADRLRQLPERAAKPCDEPVYLDERVPISLAELNLLAGLAFTGLLAIFLLRRQGARR